MIYLIKICRSDLLTVMFKLKKQNYFFYFNRVLACDVGDLMLRGAIKITANCMSVKFAMIHVSYHQNQEIEDELH